MTGSRRYQRSLWVRIGGAPANAEMDAEIEAHLQLRTDDLVRQGVPPHQARAEAERRFGDLDRARVRLHAGARERDAVLRNRDRIGSFLADVRFAMRQARRAPGFTTIAVLTLALGIALTTATFTLVDRVMLRPLPFPDSERLVALASRDSTGARVEVVSAGNWGDWNRESRSLERSAIYMHRRLSILTDDGATRVAGLLVSGDFFRVLQSRFVSGRSFSIEEVDRRELVAVISGRLSEALFAGRAALGASLRVNFGTYTVVGVLDDRDSYPSGTDVWLPAMLLPETGAMRNNINWSAIGRLRPEMTLPQARTDLDAIAARIRLAHPQALYSYGVDVRPLRDEIVGDARRYLLLLMGAVTLVLLIACANVAATNLGRGATRARELAVRSALGAGRTRLVRQLLVEHVLLGLISGALGIALAIVGVRAATSAWGARIPRAEEIQVDATTLAFALGVSLLVGVGTGIAPALLGSRASGRELVVTGTRGSTRGARQLPGTLLVAGQIALAVLLVAGAGLLIRSFVTLVSRDLGFDTRVATVAADLTGDRYRDDIAAYRYWDAMEESLRGIPGVTEVGYANWVPMGIGGRGFIDVEGKDVPGAGAGFRVVSERYFDALGVARLSGRAFSVSDTHGAEPVAIINRTMAERYWPGENPIGRRVRAASNEGLRGATAPWRRIVGVVADIRHWGLDSDASEELYVPHRQAAFYVRSMTAVVKSAVPLEAQLPRIRARARAVDPLVPVDIGTLAGRVHDSVAPQRMTVSLLTGFGVVALFLAALGTYGLLSYAVAQRNRELAVRAALGAQRRDLLLLVISGAGRVVALGLTLGISATWALARVIENQLVDIAPHDPVAIGASVLVIILAAAAAALIPAARATGADPVVALRGE